MMNPSLAGWDSRVSLLYDMKVNEDLGEGSIRPSKTQATKPAPQ
jgi:hypothetical protein